MAIAVASVARLLAMILWARFHPFIALMIVSILAAPAAGVPPGRLVDVLAFGFDPTLGNVMLLVALGAMFGKLLEASGGARALSDAMTARFGEKRSAFALSFASFLMGFPIFFNAGLVVMLPVIYAVARRVGGSFLAIALPSAIAFSAMHIYAPLQPGPVAATTTVGADIGLVLIDGLLTATIVWGVVGVMIVPRMVRGMSVQAPNFLGDQSSESDEFESRPPAGLIIALLALPYPIEHGSRLYRRADGLPGFVQRAVMG